MKFSDGQSEFSWVSDFAILCYSRDSRKLDADKKLVFYSIFILNDIITICTTVTDKK